MENTATDINTDPASMMKEAEVYYSMGLFDESLDAYENILANLPDMEEKEQEEVRHKISFIKEEIANREQKETGELSPEEISGIQYALSAVDGNAPAIYDSAFAFKELGLLKEAVEEYKKLLELDYENERIIPEFTDCLLKIYPSIQFIPHVEGILDECDLDDKDKAQIKFSFGLEMEKRDDKEKALYFIEAAAQLAPGNEEIKGRLDSLAVFFSSGSKYDYLLSHKLVTTDQLQEALGIAKKKKNSVEQILIHHFKIDKQEVGKSLSECFGYPFRSFDPELPPPVELLRSLKKTFLLQDLWIPLAWEKDSIEVLVDNPIDLNKMDVIKALLKTKKTKLYVGIKEDIEAFIRQFFDKKPTEEFTTEDISDDYDMIPDISFEEEDEEPEEQLDQFDEESGKVVRFVDQVLVSAYRKNSSDIHIEPSVVTKKTTIRFRMDGVCQEYIQVPNSMVRGILSRIKIMANLDIAERRLPQDGKIKFKRKGVPSFELRVATLPTAGGFEDVVMRVLAKAGAMKLDEMGLSEYNLAAMKDIISQPYGLILVVGPTGSGKTTSLHAALGHINKPGIKIWTAEDPIEITQHGMRQVEAKTKIGLDFARIMRAFLRADPDVIMIGEMRDQETASIGIEASLTGHLVFSTLHTNSAPETITRLLDMGLNPLNFSDAFLGVMAQRLVRRLCTKCAKEYHPSEEEFEEIVTDYGKEHFERTGIEYTSDLTLFSAEGCQACSNTGYKGRLGIHEMMNGSPKIKKMIKTRANSEELFAAAMEEGMATLKQDGIVKAFQGLTTVPEIRRVCVT